MFLTCFYVFDKSLFIEVLASPKQKDVGALIVYIQYNDT